jgi:hypothetical protein
MATQRELVNLLVGRLAGIIYLFDFIVNLTHSRLGGQLLPSEFLGVLGALGGSLVT